MRRVIFIKYSIASFVFILIAIISFAGKAQKLPNIQENSLYAPANLNIDGKSNEWNNIFQAFNKNIDAFYTISNDDNNLYLAIKATSIRTIYKIFNGGISFTINGPNENNAIAVNYPLYNRKNLVVFVLEDKPVVTKDSTINSKHVSSFIDTLNTKLTNNLKEMEISINKGIKDTISIYNEEGIKARFLFDYNMAYNYELAIPLKYLKLEINNSQKILYNIKMNGALSTLPPNVKIITEIKPDMMYALEATYVEGEYTLQKK
jgi:hypothetical protein